MSTQPDGGPAFPTTWRNDGEINDNAPDGTTCPPGCVVHLQGMSLRDYFAGQALAGCFSFWVQVHARGATIGDPDPQAITRLAYEYADEMLRAGSTS